MKKMLLAATMLICTSASAGDLIQEQQSLTEQFNADKAEYAQLTLDRAGIAKRYDDLKWTGEQVKKQMNVYNADRANLNERMASQQSVIDNHNSRCHGNFSDQGYVNSCNSEANQIDSTSGSLNQESESMKKTLSLINEAIQTQTEETEKVFAADKAAYARQNELAVAEQKIYARLNEIKGPVATCKAAIAKVDAHPKSDAAKESMHAVCGSSFDGNR